MPSVRLTWRVYQQIALIHQTRPAKLALCLLVCHSRAARSMLVLRRSHLLLANSRPREISANKVSRRCKKSKKTKKSGARLIEFGRLVLELCVNFFSPNLDHTHSLELERPKVSRKRSSSDSCKFPIKWQTPSRKPSRWTRVNGLQMN